MKEPHLILGIGELLWDVLPEGSKLGGAPANFAVMAGQLGNHAAILSRIGRDQLGRQAIDRLDSLPVDASCLEVDPVHETGRVTVSFADGEPQYTIHQPAAWDFLELSDEWVRLAERADAICFGSLAQRNLKSRQTIQTLAAQTSAACIRVFDVNLRAPFYSGEVIQESLELATVLKMNEDELPQVLSLLGLPCGRRAGKRAAAARCGPAFGGVSRARNGGRDQGQPGQPAGTPRGVERAPWISGERAGPDRRRGCVYRGHAHYLLRGADLATLNEAGNRWGGWVASQTGAMPPLPEAVRAGIAAAIEG